jgi:hypothetical protein
MGGPGWLTGIFAAVMITVAAYCASRLVAARRWRRPTHLDTDVVHVVMGVAMAGTLVVGLRFLPAGTWEAVFVVAAAWFGWQFLRVRRGVPLSQWRCPQPVPHLVESGAMLYMFLALPAVKAVSAGSGGGSGMSGLGISATQSRFSLLALVLALFMFGYVVWVGDRLTARTSALAIVVPASAVPVASGPQDSSTALVASGSVAVAGGSEPGGVDSGAAAAHADQAGGGHARGYLAPRCAALCKIAMGITMGYMLILML